MSDKVQVSRAAEDKLTYKLCLAAEVKCAELIAAYNTCMEGRTVTAAFACKRLYRESGACISEYVNQANVDTLKRRWVEAGRPTQPDWDGLLEGLVPPEHRVLPHRVSIEELKARQVEEADKQRQKQQQAS